jgi:preprotein translocase subunit SecF
LKLITRKVPISKKFAGALGKNGFRRLLGAELRQRSDVMIRLPLRDAQESAKQGEQSCRRWRCRRTGCRVELRRVEFVGPQVGKELAENGALALLVVIIGIMIYLALRFEWRFAIAAIIANLHDVIIILGFFAFLPVGVLAGRAGGGTRCAGLLGQRIGGRLRPRP